MNQHSDFEPRLLIDDNFAALPRISRADLMELTKARLSLLVVITTLVGFLFATRGGVNFWLLVHTLIGTALAAAGSSVFNQIMEVDADAKMRRTASRPLPSGRIQTGAAFALGWILSAFGVVHLLVMVNEQAAYLAGLTLAVYLLVYTPMKRTTSLNTVVGAIAGALPPVVGWVAAGGGYTAGALFLFLLLFLWQMPHFLAINWMYRDQYAKAGFVMWSNNDPSGRKTSLMAAGFSAAMLPLMALPAATGLANTGFTVSGGFLSAVMLVFAIRFIRQPTPQAARKLFYFTLLYLPAVLTALLVFKAG